VDARRRSADHQQPLANDPRRDKEKGQSLSQNGWPFLFITFAIAAPNLKEAG